MPHKANHLSISSAAVAGLLLCPLGAQTIHKVSPPFDSVSAPSAGSVGGFGWGQRQQILIDETRLAGIKGKKILGFIVRRDLDFKGTLRGGQVNLEIKMSKASRTAAKTSWLFAENGSKTPTMVFKNVVTLPTSPAVTATSKPWGLTNSVRINFSQPFTYTGGTLCIELLGRPVVGREPSFWSIDHEFGGTSGKAIEFGRSCSPFSAGGISLAAETTGLQIGSTVRIIASGRPGALPMMLLGAKSYPTGLDLSPMGAIGCRQYVDYFLSMAMKYNLPIPGATDAYLNFKTQIPYDTTLLGTSVFFQFADNERSLSKPWTTPVGLTTSNGLELQVSAIAPSLGMAVVRSSVVKLSAPFPASGSVDVEAAPIIRFLY